MYTGDTKYDVIILGCGISGSTLGYLLKKEGFRVLILESRKYHGKSKLCSGIITKRSYDILKSIYDINELEKYSVIGRFDSFTIKSIFTATISDVDLKVVNRKRFDIFLTNQYIDAGGDILDDCGPLEYDLKNKTIKCGMFSFTYNVLVGADGIVSPLRKLLTGKYQDRYVSMQCDLKEGPYKMSFRIKRKLNGYYWHISVSTKTIIGCCDFNESRKMIPEFKKITDNNPNITSEILSGIRPTGKEIMLMSQNYKDVYFVGDAAGLISPLTGEGIFHALNSAKMLYTALSENKNYTDLMKPTIIDINKELLYKKKAYSFIHRTFVIFIMSKNTLLSKLYRNKLKRLLHLN